MYVAGNKLLNYYLGLKLTSANFYHFDNDKLSKQIIIWIDTVGFLQVRSILRFYEWKNNCRTQKETSQHFFSLLFLGNYVCVEYCAFTPETSENNNPTSNQLVFLKIMYYCFGCHVIPPPLN